jgi:hypothetical protein
MNDALAVAMPAALGDLSTINYLYVGEDKLRISSIHLIVSEVDIGSLLFIIS